MLEQDVDQIPTSDTILRRRDIHNMALEIASKAVKSGKLLCHSDVQLLMEYIRLYLHPPCTHDQEEQDDD